MSGIGATSPARWHVTHFAWRIGATSLVNVTFGAAVVTGCTENRAAAADTPTTRIRRRISMSPVPRIVAREQLRLADRPIDYRGETVYAPLGYRYEQTDRPRARNSGSAAAQTARPRAAAWVGDQPAAPSAVRRRPAGQRRVALPGAAQARTGRLDQSRVEDDGKQPQGEVLRADPPGTKTAGCRSGELEAALVSNLARRSTLGGVTCAGSTRCPSGSSRSFAARRSSAKWTTSSVFTSNTKSRKGSPTDSRRRMRGSRRCARWTASSSAKRSSATRAASAG